MTIRRSLRIVLATAALALLVAGSGHAFVNHQNILTFNRPVALPGVTLRAGSYVFDTASPTALDVVVVREARSGKVEYMGFTSTVIRPRNMSPNAPVVFGEAPADQPRPIHTWYEIGSSTGHQFLYR